MPASGIVSLKKSHQHAALSPHKYGAVPECIFITSAEPTILFYSIILTKLIVENLSLEKLRRESNPKLLQRFFRHAAIQSTAPQNRH